MRLPSPPALAGLRVPGVLLTLLLGCAPAQPPREDFEFLPLPAEQAPLGLRTGGGQLFATWREDSPLRLHLVRWEDGAWREAATPYTPPPEAKWPGVRVAPDGTPWVVVPLETAPRALLLVRWEGTRWEEAHRLELDLPEDGGEAWPAFSVLFPEEGGPVVGLSAWEGGGAPLRVLRWEAEGWQSVGELVWEGRGPPSLTLAPDGAVWAGGWEENGETGLTSVWAARLSQGEWAMHRGDFPMGSSSGEQLDAPRLAFARDGTVYAGMSEQLNMAAGSIGGPRMRVARWAGGAWQQVAPAVGAMGAVASRGVSLFLDAEDRPLLAFQQGDHLTPDIHLFRLDGQQWVRVGSRLSEDRQACGLDLTGVVLHAGELVVAWTETCREEGRNPQMRHHLARSRLLSP